MYGLFLIVIYLEYWGTFHNVLKGVMSNYGYEKEWDLIDKRLISSGSSSLSCKVVYYIVKSQAVALSPFRSINNGKSEKFRRRSLRREPYRSDLMIKNRKIKISKVYITESMTRKLRKEVIYLLGKILSILSVKSWEWSLW